MNVIKVTESFDTFLSSSDAVLVLRGNWGVGKTYFWKEFIRRRIERQTLQQVAYSYISLFGKTSLADVRASIFQSGVPVATEDRVKEQFKNAYESSTRLLQSVPWLNEAKATLTRKARLARWITDLARATPYTDKYTRLIATLEYKLVTNYLICIDDLERKGSNLSIREIMGLIDELANDKWCKVVLIFNDQSLREEPDKKEFDEYREKVVDMEIEYAPDHMQALECAFQRNRPFFQTISKLTLTLDIKNIRVLRKLRRVVDAFASELEGQEQRITEEFLTHATVLSWSYYMRNVALPYEFVLPRIQQSVWSGLLKKEEEISEHERRYREISQQIDLTPSTFTGLIAHYLEKGYLNEVEVERAIKDMRQPTEKQIALEEINGIWRLFRDSFTDNATEIRTKMRSALSRHIDKLNLRECAAGLQLLSELGESVDSLIDQVIALHTIYLSRLDPDDSEVSRIPFPPLRDRLMPLVGKRNDRTIDEVVDKITALEAWNIADLEFLASRTPSQIEEWMLSGPESLHTKIRRGLLIFGRTAESAGKDQATYKSIYTSTLEALRNIRDSNDLNQLRVSAMYDLTQVDEVAEKQ